MYDGHTASHVRPYELGQAGAVMMTMLSPSALTPSSTSSLLQHSYKMLSSILLLLVSTPLLKLWGTCYLLLPLPICGPQQTLDAACNTSCGMNDACLRFPQT